MKRLLLAVVLAAPLIIAPTGCRCCRCYSRCPSNKQQPEPAIQQAQATDSGLSPVVRLAQPLNSLLVR